MNPRNRWIGFRSWMGIVFLAILSMRFSLTGWAITHGKDAGSARGSSVSATSTASLQTLQSSTQTAASFADSSHQKSFQSFRSTTGPSAKVKWNVQTGLPASLYNFRETMSAGGPEQGAREFLQSHQDLILNNENDMQLHYVRTRQSRNMSHVDFQQYFNNVPVRHAIITVHLDSNQVTMVQSNYLPNLSGSATPGLTSDETWSVVKKELGSTIVLDRSSVTSQLMIALQDKIPVLCWRITVHAIMPFGGWEFLINANSGEVVEKNRLDRAVDGTGLAYLDNAWVTPNLTSVPFKYLDGSGYLKGSCANVWSYVNNNLKHSAYSANFIYEYKPNSTTTGSSTEVFAEQNLYYHINQIHDYFKNNFGYSGRDQALSVIVHYPKNGRAMDNAYYDPTCDCIAVGDGTGVANGGNNDLARDAEVIYHEYTHAVIDTITLLGVRENDYGAAMNEAYADYFACTLFNDPHVGEWSVGSNDGLRNLDISNKYPDDILNPSTNQLEAHYTGQIWGGALWDLRNALGSVVADQIIFNTFHFLPESGNADFEEGYIALLEADQALFEGIHADQIQAVLNHRGIYEPTAVASTALTNQEVVQGSLAAIPSGHNSGTYAVLADQQYMVYVPAGGTLQVDLQGSTGSDVDLLVRRGLPVTIDNNEYGTYDYYSNSPGGSESITANASSTPVLTEGIYYIAVVNCTAANVTYSLKATVTNGASARNVIMLPVALASAGANGSYYTTETTLTNRGSSKMTLAVTYLPSLPSTGSDAGAGTVTVLLDAGEQRIISDTIAFLSSLGLPIPDSGQLLGIVSIQPVGANVSQLAVVARTTTKTISGQAGLAYSGISIANAFAGSVLINGLRQNSQDRSNLAVQNLGTTADGNLTLHLTVFDGNTATSSSAIPDITLVPGQFHQISNVLISNGLSLTSGYIKVERASGTAPFYAYGIINDQVNSDGSFILPVSVSQNTMTRLTLPVIVESGSFTSELMLTNWSRVEKKINFVFSADGLTTSDHMLHFSMTVAAGRQISIPAFIAYLRRQEIAGLPPAGTILAGPLLATSDDGSMNGISLGVRTSTPGEGGYFGVFNAALSDSQLITGSAGLFGLQQNSTNRSNLALVNLSPAGSGAGVFTIDIYSDTGSKVASFDQTVDALQWVQLNSILAVHAPSTASGYVFVTRSSGTHSFILYGVINDGGAPGQRTGDGAFLSSAI